jgi:hypothetical protein
LVVVTRPLLEEELPFKIIQGSRGIWGRDEDEIAGVMHRSIEGIAGAATVARLQAFAGFADFGVSGGWRQSERRGTGLA